jgi:hypothetical protein
VNAPSGSGGSLSALPPAPNATTLHTITATSDMVISLIFFISFIFFYKALFYSFVIIPYLSGYSLKSTERAAF